LKSVIFALIFLSSSIFAQTYEPRVTPGSIGALQSTDINTSAKLKAIVTDSLGSGKLIFSLGTISVGSGKTFTASNTLTLTGVDNSTLNIGSGGTLATAAYKPSTAFPMILVVKNVTVLTAGVPADVATISVPAEVVRFGTAMGSNTSSGSVAAVAETASGTLASASFTLFDGAGGTGNTLYGPVVGAASAGAMTRGSASVNILSSSSTIYIRQTVNSANAGTISFYITIMPLP
jgi:hypothetical protein